MASSKEWYATDVMDDVASWYMDWDAVPDACTPATRGFERERGKMRESDLNEQHEYDWSAHWSWESTTPMLEEEGPMSNILKLVSSFASTVGGSIGLFSATVDKLTRQAVVNRQRLTWDYYKGSLDLENMFERTFLLKSDSFAKLLSYLYDDLVVDEYYSEKRTGIPALSPAERLALTLRYLKGGSYLDIRLLFGCSVPHFYAIRNTVLMAICTHPELQIKLPKTPEEIQYVKDGFKSLSSDGLFSGCRYVLDGWLCRIHAPKSTECCNPKQYFSGHYKCTGLNVQAATDHHCRFVSYNMDQPGSVFDLNALSHWSLVRNMESFPPGDYCLADNAYCCTEYCLTPFTKAEKTGDSYKDSFCFRLSQLRIRVEMAFGLLNTAFGVFKSPLQGALRNHKFIIHSALALHNFKIDERLLLNANYSVQSETLDEYPFVLRDARGKVVPNLRQKTFLANHPDYEADEIEEYDHLHTTIRRQRGGGGGPTSHDGIQSNFTRTAFVTHCRERGLLRLN